MSIEIDVQMRSAIIIIYNSPHDMILVANTQAEKFKFIQLKT